jgi:hypothetical protein
MKDPDECCPKFDPKPYDKKTIVWKNKLFIQDNVMQLFHIPLNMGSVVTKMFEAIEDAKAMPKPKDRLMLAYDPSPWTSEICIAVTKDVKGAKNIKLSGTFLTKVYDGPYQDVPKWMMDMEAYVKSKKNATKKFYFYFTTCPKCIKKYGHNYVVAFAQV